MYLKDSFKTHEMQSLWNAFEILRIFEDLIVQLCDCVFFIIFLFVYFFNIVFFSPFLMLYFYRLVLFHLVP